MPVPCPARCPAPSHMWHVGADPLIPGSQLALALIPPVPPTPPTTSARRTTLAVWSASASSCERPAALLHQYVLLPSIHRWGLLQLAACCRQRVSYPVLQAQCSLPWSA